MGNKGNNILCIFATQNFTTVGIILSTHLDFQIHFQKTFHNIQCVINHKTYSIMGKTLETMEIER